MNFELTNVGSIETRDLDDPQLLDVVRLYFQYASPRWQFDPTNQRYARNVQVNFKRHDHIFLAHEAAPQAVGLAVLGRETCHVITLRYLVIDASHRDEGRGTRLLHDAEAIAIDEGYEYMQLTPNGDKSARLYRREGYRPAHGRPDALGHILHAKRLRPQATE